jgi:hypothetical protein
MAIDSPMLIASLWIASSSDFIVWFGLMDIKKRYPGMKRSRGKPIRIRRISLR